MTGRYTCNGTCETAAGCTCYGACCTGRCNQGRACVVQYPRPMPVIPCSTVARWFLAWRRFWLG